MTQPVFDLALLEEFLRRIEQFRIPVLAGIWPLVSARNAEFMKNELRVSVPDSILLRMSKAKTPEAAREKVSDCAGDAAGGPRDGSGSTDQCSPGSVFIGRGCAGSIGR